MPAPLRTPPPENIELRDLNAPPPQQLFPLPLYCPCNICHPPRLRIPRDFLFISYLFLVPFIILYSSYIYLVPPAISIPFLLVVLIVPALSHLIYYIPPPRL
jgi:hypothetical protein